MEIDGIPVFTFQPDFATPPRPRARMLTDVLGISPAPMDANFVGFYPQNMMEFTYELQSESEMVEVEEFFVQMRGQWGEFYTPTWHGDLEPVASLDSGDNELSIHPVGYAANYLAITDPPTVLGNHIFLLHEDGTLFITRVTGVTGSNPEVLTLEDNAPQNFELGQFIVGFLVWARLQNDEADFTFQGINQAQLTLSCIELIPYEGYADAE